MPDRRQERPLTVGQAAQMLGMHTNSVQRIPADQLPFFRIGSRGDRRYEPEHVRAYMEWRRSTDQRSDLAKEFIKKHDGNVFEAAADMARQLMTDGPNFKMGYTIGNALIAVTRQFGLNIEEQAAVADKIAERRPLVIVHVGGGMVQWTHAMPGFGSPDIHVLDFDREGQTGDELVEFLAEIDAALKALDDFATFEESDTTTRDVRYALVLARNEYQDLIDDNQPASRYR